MVFSLSSFLPNRVHLLLRGHLSRNRAVLIDALLFSFVVSSMVTVVCVLGGPQERYPPVVGLHVDITTFSSSYCTRPPCPSLAALKILSFVVLPLASEHRGEVIHAGDSVMALDSQLAIKGRTGLYINREPSSPPISINTSVEECRTPVNP